MGASPSSQRKQEEEQQRQDRVLSVVLEEKKQEEQQVAPAPSRYTKPLPRPPPRVELIEELSRVSNAIVSLKRQFEEWKLDPEASNQDPDPEAVEIQLEGLERQKQALIVELKPLSRKQTIFSGY